MSEPTDDDKKPEFNDPTAPVWADPTAPQVPALPAPPMSNPYAQQPPAEPPAQPSPWSPQPADPYGQSQPGQPYPAYGQSPYQSGAPAASNTSAIILTILSALSLCNILAVGPLVLGIIALTKNSTDPAQSRRLTKIGWIVFAAIWAVGILGIIAYIVFFVALAGGTTNFGSGY